MWILSTWKWNSRGGLAIIVWTGGRRASRRDWAEIEKGLARPSCQRSGWRDRRAGLALRQGMQFRKTALCWNRFLQSNPDYTYKASENTALYLIICELYLCAYLLRTLAFPCHSGPSYGCFTDPCLLNFQCSLTQSAPGGWDGEESACSAGDPGSIPWVGKIRWRRKWQPTPVLLPRESHGQRGPSGYSPWGRMGSLIQGVDFGQHNGILQKVLFGVWINLKVTGVRWDIRKPIYTFLK